MLEFITNDMLEPIGYIPLGLIIATFVLLIWMIIEKLFIKKEYRKPLSKKIMVFCSVVYIVVLLKLAYFSREPGSRKGIDVTLFSTWVENLHGRAYFVENILMFIPFGILFSMISKKGRNGWVCVLCGLLVSVLLEGMQFITQRGYCQLDDVLTNTLGTLIGWIVVKLVLKGEENGYTNKKGRY